MGRRFWLATAAMLFVAVQSAAAQNFNQVITFGDSNLDSGWFTGTGGAPSGNAPFDAVLAAAVAEGGGRYTTSPGKMSIETLAHYFGLSANPANRPDGTNYAIGGTRITGASGPPNAIPIATQINNYLAANGGRANPNALFFLQGGNNDTSFAMNNLAPGSRAAYISQTVDEFVAAIGALQAAGARHIMVRNANAQAAMVANPNVLALRDQMNAELWSKLASAGVKFIPVDFNAAVGAILTNPNSFGIFDLVNPACVDPGGVGPNYSALCATSVSPLVTPNADQSHLRADGTGHFASGVQTILADYEYNLLVAPSQISFLAEAPIKTRAALISAIQNQLELSRHQKGPGGFTTWISGDVSRLKMDNREGFPDDPGTPLALTAGFDFRTAAGAIAGVSLSAGTTKQSYSTGGNFRQNEFAGSVYLAGNSGGFWYDLIGSAGYLDYDINRSMPIGITVQPNRGSTDGWSVSGTARGGFNFVHDAFSHGPFAGLQAQRVRVDGFAESGSFTSLSFGSQTRNSLVGSLGYQWAMQTGAVRPFLLVSWNHEFASTDRLVTASLTTVAAPGYSLPAVKLGEHWASATLGARFDLAANMKGYAAITGQIGQNDATTYGAQVGVSMAF